MLTVVIPHYCDISGVERLLASIAVEAAGEGCIHPPPVVLVDDASPRDAAAVVAVGEKYSFVQVIRQDQNRGPAAARNRGAGLAQTPWIWFVDADVALLPGALAAMQAVISTTSAAGVLCGVGPSSGGESAFRRYKNYLESAWQPEEGESRSVDSKSMAIRTDVFQALGGFNEEIRDAGVEDYEFGYRLFAAGHRLHFTHRAKITHRHPEFSRQARLFYERSRDWVSLRAGRALPMDDYGTSSRQALIELVCLAILASGIASLGWPPFLLVGLALVLLWLVLDRKTLRVVAEHGESPAFFLRYFGYSCALSVPVVAGGAVGLIRAKVRR